MTNQTNIKKALQRPYDLQLFATEVLNPVFAGNFQMQQPTPATIEPTKTESKSIAKVYTYGIINLDDDTELICYEINLQPKVKIEQSKIAIQHYARHLLTTGQAALINFVNPDNKKLWRFTFIAKDSIITEKGISEKATNAKRYTYLLGTSESCKTASQRFEILANQTSLTIENLTNAFSVEKLSKDFFDEYLQHYNNFVEYLTKSNFRQSVFNANDKAVRDFTKKMLGRIVFLYFVQKKGWLGASDLDYTDGLENFMMQYYLLAGANETFYENYLKILFFDTLNKERENDNFEMPDGKIVKVPFLNGGLFDKTKYDNGILTFKSDLFHNNLNEDDPKYRGFLDFLNAYNFTIYEDSPDEQTVAVDPEMLGHIFENLLEDNKDKGAYYTPKEIVHYMCQESLTEYLKTNTENNENLEQLVKHKEINNISENQLQQIDNLLDKVKICDPAIGSGAFPMGILQEIYNIKEAITYHTNNDWKPAQVKENIIQNSIYGVDIEKGAVDIARLRFWLSLVVDEEKPKPLPNLDYKIVIGNSLISKFEDEVIEINWSLANNTALKQSRPDLFERINQNINDIFNAQNDYFHSVKDKKKLKLEIRNQKIELLETLIQIEKQILVEKGINPDYGTKKKQIVEITERKIKYEGFNKMLPKLNILKTKPDKPLDYFDWQLNFPEVLNKNLVKENTGFDIVIGNPPYVGQKGNKHLFEPFKVNSRWKNFYERKQDLYYYFMAQGIMLLNIKGTLTYINPPYFLTAAAAGNLRKTIVAKTTIQSIVNMNELMVFDNVNINSLIITLSKELKNRTKFIQLLFPNTTTDFANLSPIYSKYKTEDLNSNEWYIFKSNKTVELLSRNIIKLKDIATISPGIQTGCDKVSNSHINKLKLNNLNIKEGIYVISDEEYYKLNPSKEEQKFIKPLYKNSHIDKYYFNKKNKEWIIITNTIDNIEKYPSIKNHLLKYKSILDNRYRNFALKNADTYGKWWYLYGYRPNTNFDGEKIVSPYRSTNNKFAYSDKPFYGSIDVFFININEKNNFSIKYIVGILCSSLIKYWLNNNCKKKGKILELYQKPLSEIPIIKTDKQNQQPFIDKVNQILALKKENKDTSHIEQEIDAMVYELYGLTEAEIQTVEESIKK